MAWFEGCLIGFIDGIVLNGLGSGLGLGLGFGIWNWRL